MIDSIPATRIVFKTCMTASKTLESSTKRLTLTVSQRMPDLHQTKVAVVAVVAAVAAMVTHLYLRVVKATAVAVQEVALAPEAMVATVARVTITLQARRAAQPMPRATTTPPIIAATTVKTQA